MITNFLSSEGGLKSGGTISGDVTISGDLTVQGSATHTYDEQVQGRFDVLIDAADGGTTPFIKIIDADTDTTANTKSQILFSKYSSGTSAVDAGSIDVGITQWDTTSSNRHTYMTFNTVNAGNIGERVRITNLGKVGVDVPSPAQTLSVQGDTYDNIGIISGTDVFGLITCQGSDLAIKASNSNAIQFHASGASRFKLDTNSRISLSNNDGGAFNTIFGSNAGNSSIDSGAGFNVIIGDNAAADGAKTANYDNNTIIGYSAGEDGTSHADCVAVGFKAMETHNGSRNVAIGSAAMADTDANSDTKGSSDNVFIGHQSGGGTWTGDDSNFNVGVGGYTMDAALDGALYNVAVGYQALSAHTEGDYNTVLGAQAGLDSTTGGINTLIGFRAGYDIIGGAENTFVGSSAGQLTTAVVGATLIGREAGGGGVITTDANHTTAVGYQALYSLTEGQYNIAVGYRSLNANQTGDGCTALGYDSLLLSTGNDNTAMGRNSLASNTSGASNTGLGIWAGFGNATGGANTFVGTSAGRGVANNNNSFNTAMGKDALLSITTGGFNVAVGSRCADALTTGHQNVFVGDFAGSTTVDVGFATAIGHGAMGSGNATSAADGTVAVGTTALESLTSGSQNIAVGFEAMKAQTTGDSNVAVGYQSQLSANNSAFDGNVSVGNFTLDGFGDVALASTTAIGHATLSSALTSDASGSTAVGRNALNSLTSGQRSTAVGYYALANCDDGDNNTAIGWEALEANAGDNNTAVGAQSLKTCTGGLNTTLGYQAATALVSGTSNTIIGARAMGAADGGEQNNVIIGTDAGDVINNDAADGNVIIGQDADPSSSAGTNQIVIGQGATGLADNSVTLGNSSVTNNYLREKIELKARNDQPAIIELQADNADNNGDNWQIESSTDGFFKIKSKDSGSFVQYLDIGGSTGFVNIGGGKASGYVLTCTNDGDNANRQGIKVQGGADDASGTTAYLDCYDGDGGQVGHISNTSGTFALTDPSDKRLKKNIVDTTVQGLETVSKMKVRDFEWNKSGDKMVGGFIAQELKEVYPSAVTGTDGEVEDILDEDGNKTGERIVPMGISRDVLVPVLVKAIQELTAKVEKLESKG